jgi:hypothetical protein
MSIFFYEFEVFFPPIGRKIFSPFCDVAQMAIIHKKDVATFGYRKVLELKTCLNPSILGYLL